ncbi:unnamed protein product [Rotaria magnacalcarata]|uniref:Vacuolar protein sorting-associated protein 35 n=2 Tax=Rotaria magnacalcarata TaxID=392030 RepID=A0A816RMC3_9BILA|nr:unnamed protein product [Rotaria magnacalcarata]CAF2077098.1 unnamed protein product [Rotaria magnacalcarata]CAF3755032.1 unnamed protein product [Rotaria magnacalcarata]CAF4029031.1 unnamed protein product [Rotaria magnacalcarata]
MSMQKTADSNRSSNAGLSMDNQEKLLADALQNVRQHAFAMKRVLDQQSVMEGLKHAANMLGELRTSLLSPKNYYELHVVVVEELHHLELYLADEFEHGRGSHDLYEVVQYAGNIVPRLYLLITIGHVYIRANELPRREVLRDLVEMCRGVQHPLRGLFLRNYLLQCVKSLLPDTEEDNQEESKTGTILDSLDFILLNFSEMNKLWVRMQYQGHTRDLQRREQERRELRILVGTNLVRLSELECVNVERYKTIVLPKIMEQVVSCRDPIAQEYLMECIIQVFPDEYHLNTLNEFLKACRELSSNVNIRNILISLIDRLTAYSTREGTQQNIPENVELFEIFSEQIAEVIKSRINMPSEDIVALQSALLNLSLKCYRDQYEYGNKVLENTRKIFDNIASDTQVPTGTQTAKELVKMLKIPIDCYDILDVLKLNHYKLGLQLLSYRERHTVCMYIINGILDKETIIPTAEQVTQLFELLSTLIVDQADNPSEASRQTITNEDFVEEQNLVARLYNNFQAVNDPDQQYHIIKICQETFKNGGLERMRFTYPPIIMQAYALTFRYKTICEQDEKWEKKCQKLFQLCNQLVNTLTKLETNDLPLRLYLQGALAASEIGSENAETIAYEFFSQAYTLYEEQAGDTRAQCASLTLLIGTLEKVTCFGEENHSTLRQSLTQAATRLVKRPDQVRTLLLCTHLFWSAQRVNESTQKSEQVRDGEKVLACLKKATKLTTQIMDQSVQVQLYNELLNCYIYYFNQNHPDIDITVLNSLIEKLQSETSKISSNESDEFIHNQIKKTFDYLRQQSQVEKFQGLQINN